MNELLFKRKHIQACNQGQPGYEDPESELFVLSSYYLLQQGECCGSGCRHCPYKREEQLRARRPLVASFPYLGKNDD